MRVIYIFISSVFLAGCVATNMSPQLNEGLGRVPVAHFSDARTVEEIRNLKSQTEPPLKVAVMPLNRWPGLSWDERVAIKEWGKKMEEIGFLESLEFVPEAVIASCSYKSEPGCFLNQSRAAGARLGADAILFINSSKATDAYTNPLSILNLTVVGMWIVPAHHRESYAVCEASLFDINSGYLYAIADGYGEHKTVRPFMYLDRHTGAEKASLEAINEVGEKLYEMAKKKISKLKMGRLHSAPEISTLTKMRE